MNQLFNQKTCLTVLAVAIGAGIIGVGGTICAFLLFVPSQPQPQVSARPTWTAIPTPTNIPDRPTSTPLPTLTPAPTPTPEPPTATPLPEGLATGKLNEDVMVNGIRWKFLEAEDMGDTLESDNQFVDPMTTSGRFIRVRFEMENMSSETRTFSDINLIDEAGRSFEDSSDASIWFVEDRERCTLDQLNPNVPKTCTKIFEVPLNATGLKAEVGDFMLFTSDEGLIDLELN